MSETAPEYGTPAAYPALPPGRHGLGSEYVDRYQRRRLVVAVAELAHEEGLAGVTVTRLTARAGISRKTFYDYFENRDECVEYASREASAYLFQPRGRRLLGEDGKTKAAIRVEGLLSAVAAEPNLAELALIHAPALGGVRGRRFQDIAVGAVAGLLSGGDDDRAARTETTASAIIGVIACRLRRGEAVQVAELSEVAVGLEPTGG